MYDCDICGQKNVNGGVVHFCAEGLAGLPPAGRIDGYVLGTLLLDEAFNQYTPGWTLEPTSGKAPHKCVVCGGIGKVQYNPENPFFTYATSTVVAMGWSCNACHGTGVLWG